MESLDFRNAGHCACGKRVQAPEEPRRRNVAFERDLTREAARGLVDPQRLIEHAESRALTLSSEYVSDPMLIQPGRDRLRDVREEIADARNHLVWWAEEHIEDEQAHEAKIVLRLLATAYDRLLSDA